MPRKTKARRTELSSHDARALVLAAQGFGGTRPARPGARQLAQVANRLGVIQIDSVNVLVRSHFLPFFSRLGPYRPELLEKAAYDAKRRSLFEYWGHEASLLPLEMQHLFRWRMQRARKGIGMWNRMAELAKSEKRFISAVLKEVAVRGPVAASDLSMAGKNAGPWWGWSKGKVALEYLFWAGYVTTASRRGFERVYDLTERVIPRAILDLPTPTAKEAQRELLRISVRALGVATERDLRDYFRLDLGDARERVRELVAGGEFEPVEVEGWTHAAYVASGTRVPPGARATALLSPFDSLVWERSRLLRLFDFHYRLEIYTPAHKRVHGYYVLPFLFDGRLVARVDLKARRPEKHLDVVAVHYEPGVDVNAARDALRPELEALAAWLQLESVAPIR